MALSKETLRVTNAKIEYLEDYHVITKHDNPEVIGIHIEMERKEACVVMRYEDLGEEPTHFHKPPRKRKKVASDAIKIVQKPPKKKVVQQKEIEKEIEEVVASTVLIPSKTRSGKTPRKTSCHY